MTVIVNDRLLEEQTLKCDGVSVSQIINWSDVIKWFYILVAYPWKQINNHRMLWLTRLEWLRIKSACVMICRGRYRVEWVSEVAGVCSTLHIFHTPTAYLKIISLLQCIDLISRGLINIVNVMIYLCTGQGS